MQFGMLDGFLELSQCLVRLIADWGFLFVGMRDIIGKMGD